MLTGVGGRFSKNEELEDTRGTYGWPNQDQIVGDHTRSLGLANVASRRLAFRLCRTESEEHGLTRHCSNVGGRKGLLS